MNKQRDLYQTLITASIIAAPAAAALLFGHEVYQVTVADTGAAWLAIIAGIATAIALEATGIAAGHTAAALHTQGDRRWLVAAAVMAVYVAIGLYALRGSFVAVAFVLAPLAYIIAALRRTAEVAAIVASAEETAAAQRRHELERLEIELDHERKTAAAQRRHEVKVAAASLVPGGRNQTTAPVASAEETAAAYVCDICGHAYASAQALGGHMRWHTAAPVAYSNGTASHDN